MAGETAGMVGILLHSRTQRQNPNELQPVCRVSQAVMSERRRGSNELRRAIAAILALLSLLLLPRGLACRRVDLRPLGFSRSPQRFLPAQSLRTIGRAVGSRILPPDSHCAAAADYARTQFSDSSATSTGTRNARKPAPGIRPRGHREECYCAAAPFDGRHWFVRKSRTVRRETGQLRRKTVAKFGALAPTGIPDRAQSRSYDALAQRCR